MKAYFEKNYNGEPYDALGRRKNQPLFYIMGGGKIAPNAKKGAVTGPSAATSAAMSRPSAKSTATAASSVRTISSVGGGSAQAKALEGQIAELKLQNDTLDKERDFYFGKLRDIELLLQARPLEAGPGQELSQDILKILYAAEDEKVTVTQEGELTITAPTGEQVTGDVLPPADATPEDGVAAGGDAEMAE